MECLLRKSQRFRVSQSNLWEHPPLSKGDCYVFHEGQGQLRPSKTRLVSSACLVRWTEVLEMLVSIYVAFCFHFDLVDCVSSYTSAVGQTNAHGINHWSLNHWCLIQTRLSTTGRDIAGYI